MKTTASGAPGNISAFPKRCLRVSPVPQQDELPPRGPGRGPHLQGTYWVRQEPPSDSASGIYKIIDILPDGLGSFVNFLLLFLPILLK